MPQGGRSKSKSRKKLRLLLLLSSQIGIYLSKASFVEKNKKKACVVGGWLVLFIFAAKISILFIFKHERVS